MHTFKLYGIWTPLWTFSREFFDAPMDASEKLAYYFHKEGSAWEYNQF